MFFPDKTKCFILLMTIVIACLMISTSMAQESLQQFSTELAAIAGNVSPSVVSIFFEGRATAEREKPIDRWLWEKELPFEIFKDKGERRVEVFTRKIIRPQEATGTGFVLDKEGHIVTASQIMDKSPREIKVKLADSREFKAELVGADPDTGVAVIKINAEGLTPVKSGDSDNIKAGELALTFSNPYSKGITVSMGIVSATGRMDLGITTYEDFIQTDTTVEPGSIGGPLVNAAGEVIGMILAARSEERNGMGPVFAVPMNMVREVADDLLREGRVTRGWFGVQIQDVNAELAEKMKIAPLGALVIESTGPAKEADIRAGDIITEFDGNVIKNVEHLKNMVARTRPGKEVAVKVIREGEEKVLHVKMGERTEKAVLDFGKREPVTKGSGWMGITVQELTPELAREFGYEDERGVLISDVKSDSPADTKGLKTGDLIQEIDHQAIGNIEDYEKAAEAAKDIILLRIKRGERVWYEVIKVNSK